MGSSSFSSASLPLGLPIAEGCPALPGPKYLGPRIHPCYRPSLLPRLAFDIGPCTMMAATIPGAGSWGLRLLKSCLCSCLFPLSRARSRAPRKPIDGRIYRRPLETAYCGMCSLGLPSGLVEGALYRCRLAYGSCLHHWVSQKRQTSRRPVASVGPQLAEPDGTRGVCSLVKNSSRPGQKRRHCCFAYARWPNSSIHSQCTKAIFIVILPYL